MTVQDPQEVVPKRPLRASGDHMLVYSVGVQGKYLAAMKPDSKAAVTVIDPETREGYRYIGTPEVHGSGEDLHAAAAIAKEKGIDPPIAIVPIHIEHICTLTPGPATGEAIV